MAYIEFKNINKFYGDNHVLKGINLKIEKGQFVTLLMSFRLWEKYPAALPCGAGSSDRWSDHSGWGRHYNERTQRQKHRYGFPAV